jgi:hypothetical protein
MALFFDKGWFDAALLSKNLSRDDMAKCAGISLDDLTMMFKDQMEVSPDCVGHWAAMFGLPSEEIALRCGVSTRILPTRSDRERLDDLEMRVAALERLLKLSGVSALP